MIGVVHLGLGNVGSLTRCLERRGLPHRVLTEPVFTGCQSLLFPGVGHYGRACERLDDGWRDPLGSWIGSGRPFLGICLGYQLLYAGSDEAPGARGLGVFDGTCREVPSRRRPHMGWNRLQSSGFTGKSFRDSWMYFVHSYAPEVHREAVFTCEDGGPDFAVGAFRGTVGGVQFHPEKSAEAGARLLEAFVGGVL